MGFPVQLCAAGVVPKLLIVTLIISVSTLARSLLCWLMGSSFFFDDDDYVESIYDDDDDDDDDDSVDDAPWLSYSSDVRHHMHPHAAIAHLNEPDATNFINTQHVDVEIIHGHDVDDDAVLLTSPHHAPTTYALPLNVDDDAMLPTSCRMLPHGPPLYAVANLDESDTDPEDNESAHYDHCCVCLCHVSPSSAKQLPHCAHVLHSSCLDAWLHHGHMKVCPLCRTPT